jgi:hypothetical protein
MKLRPHINRRAFLTSAAVLPLVASAVPVAEAMPASDPLPGLWADRQRFLTAWRHEVDTAPEAGNFDTPQRFVLERQQTAAEHALCSTQAITIEGLAAQIEYAQSEFGDGIKHGWAEPYASIFSTLVAGVTAIAQDHTLNRVKL